MKFGTKKSFNNSEHTPTLPSTELCSYKLKKGMLQYIAAIISHTVTVTVQSSKFSKLTLQLHSGYRYFFETVLLVVFAKGDRNLKLKLAELLTSQWYYLITPLAAKQYNTTEEPRQELHILYTHSRHSAGECLSSQ